MRRTQTRTTRPRECDEFNPFKMEDVMGRPHDFLTAGRKTWRVNTRGGR
jgi:hypothetical protein